MISLVSSYASPCRKAVFRSCGIDLNVNLLQLSGATKTRTTGCRTVGLLGILLSILETLKYPACFTLEEVTVLIFLDRKDPAASDKKFLIFN